MREPEMTREELLVEVANLRAQCEQTQALKKELAVSRARLKNERERLFRLLDGIPAFIYLQERDYSISYANRCFIALFGKPNGRPCYSVMQNRTSPCPLCPTLRVLEDSRPQVWVWEHSERQEIYKIYDYPFHDVDGRDMVLEMGIDITEQHQLEQTRAELFANVSHELRTPLARIMGYTEALKDNVHKNEGEFRSLVDCIYTNSVALNHLIGDLFELSLLQAGVKINLAPAILQDVLADFCAEQGHYLRRHGLSFEYDIHPKLPLVLADVKYIIQVLRNLLDNAVRYTDLGGLIRIKAASEGDDLLICVRDTGCGIAFDHLPHVFDRFFRGVRTVNDHGHSGLGLHICKSIIDQHKGMIWVESEEGKGTAFFIRLPGISGGTE